MYKLNIGVEVASKQVVYHGYFVSTDCLLFDYLMFVIKL